MASNCRAMDLGNMTGSSGLQYDKMSVTVKAIQEYLLNRSEDSYQKVQRDLTLLESSCEVFDVSTTTGAQLYSNLRDLFVVLENTNPLIWSVISILQKACNHSYNGCQLILSNMFVPLLGRILTENLPHEKKLRLLGLIQELTYDIKIQWQEPYLQPMLSGLTACVRSADAQEVSLALSIIVNLLHGNPPARYAFLRCVKAKDFLKQLLNKNIKSLEYRVEVSKFMILVADVTEANPDEKEVRKFVGLTFQTVNDSVQNGNLSLVRHTVNFFGDVTRIEKLKSDILAYPSYEADINSVVKLLEDMLPKHQCLSVLLDFLGHFVGLHSSKITCLLERIVGVASKIINCGDKIARPSALNLLLCVSRNTIHQNTPESQSVNHALHEVIPVLVGILKDSIPRKEATTLLQLLCEFTNVSTLKKAIVTVLDSNSLRFLFEPLLSEWHRSRSALSPEDAIYYVEALSLISKCVSQNADCLQLFSWLTQQSCVLAAVATALKCAPPSVKCEILKFPSVVGFCDQSVSALAECMNEVWESPVKDGSYHTSQKQMLAVSDSPPLFGIEEKNRLDQVLSSLEKKTLGEGEGSGERPMSALMSIFQYRTDVDAREKRLLNSSLEIANYRIAHLSQQVEASNDEMQKLRNCLFSAQMRVEQTKFERDVALAASEAAKADASKAFRESEERKARMERKVKEVEKVNQLITKSIEEKNADLQKKKSLIQTLTQDFQSLEQTHKANLRLLLEKDEEIKMKNEQIHQLETIKNAIYQISSGSKKIEN